MAKRKFIYLKALIEKGEHSPQNVTAFCRRIESHYEATKIIARGRPRSPNWEVEFLDLGFKATSIISPDKKPIIKFSKIEGEL